MAFDPNVCIGFGAPEHVFPVDQLSKDWLCPECQARLAEAIKPKPAVVDNGVKQCIAGGHPAGSRYYDCVACYGD